MAVAQLHQIPVLMLFIYFSFNKNSQTFLNILVLPAMSSLTAMYGLVASSYLTSVVNFTAFSFGHSHKPAAQQCSTHTGNTAC